MSENNPLFEQEARKALAREIIDQLAIGGIDGAKRKIENAVLSSREDHNKKRVYDLSSVSRQNLLKYLQEEVTAFLPEPGNEQQAEDKANLLQFIDRLPIPPLTDKSRQQESPLPTSQEQAVQV